MGYNPHYLEHQTKAPVMKFVKRRNQNQILFDFFFLKIADVYLFHFCFANVLFSHPFIFHRCQKISFLIQTICAFMAVHTIRLVNTSKIKNLRTNLIASLTWSHIRRIIVIPAKMASVTALQSNRIRGH